MVDQQQVGFQPDQPHKGQKPHSSGLVGLSVQQTGAAAAANAAGRKGERPLGGMVTPQPRQRTDHSRPLGAGAGPG